MGKNEQLIKDRDFYKPDDLVSYFLQSRFTDRDREIVALLKEKEYQEAFKNASKLIIEKQL